MKNAKKLRKDALKYAQWAGAVNSESMKKFYLKMCDDCLVKLEAKDA